MAGTLASGQGDTAVHRLTEGTGEPYRQLVPARTHSSPLYTTSRFDADVSPSKYSGRYLGAIGSLTRSNSQQLNKMLVSFHVNSSIILIVGVE